MQRAVRNATWSATKTRQYDPESRPRMPFRPSAIRGHSTVASNQSSPPGMQRAVGYKRHCSFISPIPFNYAVQKRRRLVRESYYTVRSLAKTRPSPLVVETEVTISRGAFGVLSTVVPPSGKIQPIRAFLPACRRMQRRSPSRSYKRAAAVPLP